MKLLHVACRLAVFSALSLCSSSARAGSCIEQAALPMRPQWISSAELNSENSQILIADPKSKELFSFDLKSGKLGTVKVPGDLVPSFITRIQGRFLIKDRDEVAILSSSLSSGYKVLKEKARLKSGGGSVLGSLYSNWVTNGHDFVGFGSVASFNPGSAGYDPSRRFQLGFVKGQVSAETGEFRDIQLLEATEENDPYLLGLPYFCATSEGFFFVKMTSPYASIVQVKDTAQGRVALTELPAFPEEFRRIPDLKTKSSGPASAVERFEKIEESHMVAGLFGQGKYLYLLTRQPDPKGQGTEWLLHKIDPNVAKPLGAIRLPTRASHLSIVVGPDYWHLFERGHIRAWGEQDIEKVIHVPSAWITSLGRSPSGCTP